MAAKTVDEAKEAYLGKTVRITRTPSRDMDFLVAQTMVVVEVITSSTPGSHFILRGSDVQPDPEVRPFNTVHVTDDTRVELVV